jgi:hypothetical protein
MHMPDGFEMKGPELPRQRGGNIDIATLGAMAGFAVMMTLDVALS